MSDSGTGDGCCRAYPNASGTLPSDQGNDASDTHTRSPRRSTDTLPFVAQDGRRLYMVAGDLRGWVVAELEFDPVSCTFRLTRQTEYQWPREVLGRLLARTMAAEGNEREANRLSDAFTEWLANQIAA